MRKALLLALFLLPLSALAQVANPSIVAVSSAPTGSCSGVLPLQIIVTTGVIYSCQSGTWASGTGSTLSGNISNTPTAANQGLIINGFGAFSADNVALTENAGLINMQANEQMKFVTTAGSLIIQSGGQAYLDGNGSGFGVSIATQHAEPVGIGTAGQILTMTSSPLASGTNSVSGCSLTSALGGAWAGSFHSGTTGTCTVTITPGITATNGFTCWSNDLTTVADVLHQTSASNATTAVISGTTASGDVINWGCIAY